MISDYWIHRFKQDPLSFIIPVLSVIGPIYFAYRLAYANTVLEAVKFGVWVITGAIWRSKK